MYKKIIRTKTITSFVTVVIIATGLLFCISSCKKETADDSSFSDEEVAESVTQSVSAASGGLAEQTEFSARMAGSHHLICGAESDTTVSGQNVPGAVIMYNYRLTFHRTIVCRAGIPTELKLIFTGHSSYQAPRISSNDSSIATVSIAGLQASAPSYIINMDYVRNGTQQSSVGLHRSFSSTITIISTDLTVDKTTHKIVSGTSAVLFTATGSGGKTFSRSGTLSFLGNSKATILLSNGRTFSIRW